MPAVEKIERAKKRPLRAQVREGGYLGWVVGDGGKDRVRDKIHIEATTLVSAEGLNVGSEGKNNGASTEMSV